jgi:glutaminase-like protein
MVSLSFVDSDTPLPGPTSKNSLRFHRSTLDLFRRQLESIAQQEKRRLFFATDQERLVAVGLTNKHQVLSKKHDEVQLSGSHARHRVSSEIGPLAVGKWYEMAIDPVSSEILGATESAAPVFTDQPQVSRFEAEPSDLLPVSQADAARFFSRVRLQPHIPFQYPSNGCMSRAHEMCRLIERHFDPSPQNVVAKIWNFGNLVVHTNNNPICEVSWGFHVAPVVHRGKGALQVIDPSLFDKPVTITDWRNRQTDLSKPYALTSADAYDRAGPGLFVAERQRQTAEELQYYLGTLISQIYTCGPVPYTC